MPSFYLVIAIIGVVWILLNLLYRSRREYFEKHGLKLYYGVVLVYRRKSSGEAFKSKVLSGLSYIFIPIFGYILVLFYYAMTTSFLGKIGIIEKSVEVQLLIPGINITGEQLLYFAIAIGVAALIHEFLHALTARLHGINVKSMGFALILVIPIAFTEIDEKEFITKPKRVRITVLSAGPVANYVLALLALVLLNLVVSSYGIVVVEVLPNSLAEQYGIKPEDVIVAINGEPATRSNLARVLGNNTWPGVKFVLTIMRSSGEIVNITVFKPANITRLGIAFSDMPRMSLVKTLGLRASLMIEYLIIWLYIVNLGLAIINTAPIFISDGGRVFYELLGSRGRTIAHLINATGLALLILAVYPIG
ncbi:MAG: site-2 protease family protein [Thermoprotei archaeon]